MWTNTHVDQHALVD